MKIKKARSSTTPPPMARPRHEVEKTLKAAGVQVVAREKTNDKATDFKAILTKMKGKRPTRCLRRHGRHRAPMLKQARELGIKAVFSFGDGACTDTMKQLAGDASAEGLICSQAGLPAQAASKEFLDAYKGKFNVDRSSTRRSPTTPRTS